MNESTKKILLIGLPLLAGGALIYILNKKRRSPLYEQPPATDLGTSVIKTGAFPLKKGSKGEAVRELQRILNYKGANLQVDGDWGPKTDAAVQQFLGTTTVTEQQFNQLSADYRAQTTQAVTTGTKSVRSINLIAQWNSNPGVKFVAIKDFSAPIVTIDYAKKTFSTGKYLNIKNGQVLSRSEFSPQDVAANGMLIMKYKLFFGVQQGNCVFDPDFVTLM